MAKGNHILMGFRKEHYNIWVLRGSDTVWVLLFYTIYLSGWKSACKNTTVVTFPDRRKKHSLRTKRIYASRP